MEEPVRLTRRETVLQTVKYFCFAASAGAIQEGSFALFTSVLHLFGGLENPYWPRYLISLALSVVWNFTLNRRYTFKSANNVPAAMLKVLGYYAVFTPLSLWWGVALTNGQPDWVHYAVQVGTLLVNGVTEFLFQRFFVFGKSINTNQSGLREEARKREGNHS